MLLPDNIHPDNSIYYNGAIVLQVLQKKKGLDLVNLYLEVKQVKELTFPVCAGGKEVVAAFGLHSYPDILITDKEGKVYKWYNYSEDMDSKIIAEINQLLQ